MGVGREGTGDTGGGGGYKGRRAGMGSGHGAYSRGGEGGEDNKWVQRGGVVTREGKMHWMGCGQETAGTTEMNRRCDVYARREGLVPFPLTPLDPALAEEAQGNANQRKKDREKRGEKIEKRKGSKGSDGRSLCW